MGKRGRDGKTGKRPLTPEERAQAERDIRFAIYYLQDAAYANLRAALANVAIFFGFIGALTIAAGAADGARLLPTAVCVLAGVVGAGYYPARSRPRLAGYVLLAAMLLLLLGIGGLVLVVGVHHG